MTVALGSIIFKNIICEDCQVSAGFFYGLPESKIDFIGLENIKITYSNEEIFGKPAMMSDIKDYSKLGFYFNNVKEVEIKNVKITGQNGDEYIFENIDIIKR